MMRGDFPIRVSEEGLDFGHTREKDETTEGAEGMMRN